MILHPKQTVNLYSFADSIELILLEVSNTQEAEKSTLDSSDLFDQ